MTARFERLTNLLAVLLDASRPLSLEEILERVPGYPADHESARRQFERDKDALRGMGVPIRIDTDPFGDVPGYRVDRREYELPELELTPEELAALHTAVTAVDLEGGEGTEALWKLGGLGSTDAPMLGALPNVPTLPYLVEACRIRATVAFSYRGEERVLEPYAVAFRGGHWYVIGRDRDRHDLRSFRADRIDGEVSVGDAQEFERPDNFEAAALLHDEPWRYGDEPAVDALVQVDHTVAPWVVARLGEANVVERRKDHVVVRLTVTNRSAFRSFVVGLLDHAEVLEPAELRHEVVSWLDEISGGLV